MRSLVFLFISLFVCLELNAQIIEEVDECFPFQGYFAAIKSGDKWGFINREGELVIKFRSDLVISKSNQNVCNAEFESATHPVISDNRSLIKKLKGDVYYYGYINEKGVEIIEPQFLNASHFMNGFAIVVKLAKNVIGFNEILNKDIIAYKLEEYIIDVNGNLYMILNNIRNYVPTKNKSAPEFHSKFIAPNLIAVQGKKGKWDIYNF
jgi:hypothetical protein